MTASSKPVFFSIALCSLFLIFSCMPGPTLRTSVPRGGAPSGSSASVDAVDSAVGADTIDFAMAFDSSSSDDPEINVQAGDSFSNVSQAQRKPMTFVVPTKRIRVVLIRNERRAILYSVGKAGIRDGSGISPASGFRGRLQFIPVAGGGVTVSDGSRSIYASLPCTLFSAHDYNFIEIAENTYRGGVILIPGGVRGTLTIVNFLEVEEYLRGVVPLELGKRGRAELEALKAQAVAARTYAYKRIIERRGESYDVFPDVTDQVYGGVTAEYREADQAIEQTADLIMTFGDSVITAYYHSTCGGVTTSVSEAWGKPACSYLVPVADVDSEGRAWCRASRWFEWSESWSLKQASYIVTQSLQRMNPSEKYRGDISGISVAERYSCGRIKSAEIIGNGWKYRSGGDRIRFILRRGSAGNPILRSSNFSVAASGARKELLLKGRGYGHGVGMCQMGAVGRAQAGQSFTEILTAYYSGITIASAVMKGEQERGIHR